MNNNPKTESDLVTTEDIIPHLLDARRSESPVRRRAAAECATMAAITMGSLRKGTRKRWTGWHGDKHLCRGSKVILPCGTVAEIFGVKRGLAAVTWQDPFWIEGIRRDVIPVSQLKVFKNPAAVLLGTLKSGCRELRSEKKIAACRKNGQMPCRAGKKRGRPAKALRPALPPASVT